MFHSSTGRDLSPEQVVEEIVRYMREDPSRKYKITIGTDSEQLQSGDADFVSAIVVHRIGNGGRYFWRRFEQGKFHTLRDRIIREVLISLDLGKVVLVALKELAEGRTDVPGWAFEIHIDVGENGPTKSMIQEVVGMVRAENFEARTKPDSYAASNVADRYV